MTRNVTVAGHRTSVRLEPYMWDALREICLRERKTVHEVCTMIAHRKGERGSFTAAIRVAILAYYRLAARPDPRPDGRRLQVAIEAARHDRRVPGSAPADGRNPEDGGVNGPPSTGRRP